MFYLINFYMMLMMMLMLVLFIYFYINQMIIYLEFELINLISMKMEIFILLDWISMLFISVVLIISSMVIMYSFEYMQNDNNMKRFIMLILGFVMSMLLMIVSPNLISILLGWDGLGLISYCLVIYYQSSSSFNSGMVTVLTNRLGDILILMSISLMISYGSWNFLMINDMNILIYFSMMIASFTKSAQIPFSSWLPLAMAAPTPVSSLVHSSTLVTAGVYILIRLNYLLFNNYILKFMMLISLMTMFLSGLGANFEFDLKKIIALSTLSQLGLMIFCLSLKMMEISLFHLLTHAMFKSMLFMCAGVIIHNMLGCQDIRYISMTFYNMPMISIMFNCSNLSLCGIPFMSGFFSKDMILELYMMNMFNKFIFFLLFISMGFTIMYSFRLLMYSFIKVPQLIIYYKYNSFNSYMGMSMYMLFFLSIFMGLVLSWILFSFKNKIFLTIKFKLMIYFFMILGMLISLIVPKLFNKKIIFIYLNKLLTFYSMLWFMPMLYSYWMCLLMKFSNNLIMKLEMGWIEYYFGGWIMNFLKIMFSMEFFMKNYYYLMILMMMMIMIFMF